MLIQRRCLARRSKLTQLVKWFHSRLLLALFWWNLHVKDRSRRGAEVQSRCLSKRKVRTRLSLAQKHSRNHRLRSDSSPSWSERQDVLSGTDLARDRRRPAKSVSSRSRTRPLAALPTESSLLSGGRLQISRRSVEAQTLVTLDFLFPD